MIIQRSFFVSIVSTGLLLISTMLTAQVPECSITVATLSGTATNNGQSLSVGSSLAKGDKVQVGSGSVLELTVGNGGSAKIGADSEVYVDASYCPDASSDAIRLKLISGSLWAKGNPAQSKYHISSEHFLVMVGTTTVTLNARHLDTTFTLSRESQHIETLDWADTVEVESYTFPFKGEVSTVYALDGDPTIVPWGGKALTLKKGEQSTHGFKESHISSKPQETHQEELLFDATGTYLVGS